MSVRRGLPLRLALVLAAASLASSCSSSPEASGGTPPPPSVVAANARLACERYYALDRFLRTEAVDTRGGSPHERVRALRALRDVAESMTSAVASAVTIGDLPADARVRSAKVLREMRRLVVAGGDIGDFTGRAEARTVRRLARIEAACIAAGMPVPEEDLELRRVQRSDD